MNLKKLSLAAAISIGVFTAGTAAQAQVGDQSTTTEPTIASASNPAPQAQAQPSAYGAGAAGTFKTTGTEKPYGGNAAGSTEISTFRSPVNQPTGGAAGMAAQGVYGECTSCGTSATGGAAGVTGEPPSLQQSPVESPSQMTIQQSVATPTTSELTGGAAQAESQGMRCAVPPADQPPAITIPCPTSSSSNTGGAAPVNSDSTINTSDTTTTTGEAAPINTLSIMPIAPSSTGGAAQVCPTVPTCVPEATCGKTSANAPKGFNQPVNPGAIAPPPASSACQRCPKEPSAACPVEPVCPAEPAPACPTQAAPIEPTTGGAADVCPTDTSAAQTVPTCPVAPSVSTVVPYTGAQPVVVSPTTVTGTQASMPVYSPVAFASPFCPTGAAAPITGPVTGTCSGLSSNTNYIERQVYAYPRLPNSVNTMVPGGSDSTISLGATAPGAVISTNYPNTALNVPYSSMQGYTTGAASPVMTTTGINSFGCPVTSQISSGASVSRLPIKYSTGPISIQTQSGYQIQRMVLVPSCTTGAAAPAVTENMFTDISSNYWASNSINRLASAGVVSGYPDRTFRPNLAVSRAEFSSMLVTGLNLQSTPTIAGQVFKDVPNNHWANSSIDKVYNKGLIAGYSNDTFQPNSSITRAEALTTMARALPTSDMTAADADQILSQYSDSGQVPNWAKIPVAKAVRAGLLQGTPNPNRISASNSASRADIASMLSQLRQDLALEQPITTAAVTGAAASIQQQTVTIPVLNVKFNDRITARASQIGDAFTATTLEPVTVNNVVYPQGSTVDGRIVEVIRPSGNNAGALKLAFTDIKDPAGTSSALPSDVITAQVQKANNQNILSRVMEFPFVFSGRVIGTVGRTVGAMTVVAGNSVEQVLNEGGIAVGDLGSADWSSAGRSGINSAYALGKGALNVTQTAFSGVTGVLGVTSDELGYLTAPGGGKIASVNPSELVSIAFGCQ